MRPYRAIRLPRGRSFPCRRPSVQVSRARSGPRPGGAAGQGGGSQFALHALRRWWKIALPVGLLLACGAVAVVYLLFEPQYEASALLEINEHPQYIAFEPKEAGVSRGYFRTQMEIIQSRWILGRTVAAIEKIKELPEIFKQRDKIEWLKKQVTVVSANDSDVFEIKYSSPDPENAALVVNTVTEQYLTAQEEEETKRNSKIVAALAERDELSGGSREDAAERGAGRDASTSEQGNGTLSARAEFAGQDPAGGNAKSADRRSSPEFDAQGTDRGDRRGTGGSGESQRREGRECERRPWRCLEQSGNTAVGGTTQVAGRHDAQGHGQQPGDPEAEGKPGGRRERNSS